MPKPQFNITLLAPKSEAQLESLRELLREYQQSIGVDLCFQNFEAELAALPGDYMPPDGRLIIGEIEGKVACCVAMHRFDAETAEMKRLFVRPAFRGYGLGRLLTQTIIEDARSKGYQRLVLDTMPDMRDAQAMYEQFGFRDIPAYTVNPVQGARFMGLTLD